MCTILLAWRCVRGATTVMAANRDEFFGRPSAPPGVLVDQPRVVGGRDLRSGGTWLAVGADGRFVAVTNRLTTEQDPSRRSRGGLPLWLLGAADDDVPGLVSELDSSAYNPFNLMYVSSSRAVVGHHRGQGSRRLDVIGLHPGIHVLTLHDVDQAASLKVSFLSGRLYQVLAGDPSPEAMLGSMEELLAEHGDDQRDDLECTCVHGHGYGTVSSSSLLVTDDGRPMIYRHSPGPPCATGAVDVGGLFGIGTMSSSTMSSSTMSSRTR